MTDSDWSERGEGEGRYGGGGSRIPQRYEGSAGKSKVSRRGTITLDEPTGVLELPTELPDPFEILGIAT